MKVMITCEKCGGKILEGGGYQDAPHIARRFSNGPALECPNCSKLTYGPLTEEMMAEALRQARGDDIGREPYGDMARFVLRLLDKAPDAVAALKDNDQSKIHWREWLSDLARPYR